MTKEKLALVVSDYNADITSIMGDIAKEHIKFLDAELVKSIQVPGAYDMPLAVKKLLGQKDIDGVVTLGAIIEGDTSHDEIVAHNAARKIIDLSLENNKPVSLGISGPKMTRADGVKRIEGYAKRAVESCLKMIRRLG